MRTLSWRSLSLILSMLALGAVPSHAQTCSCPWEVKQLNTIATPGFLSECPMLHHNGEQNSGFWADNQCSGRGGACTFLYTPISCTENPDGSVTASGLLNYKCNQC
jgi:hypothetical protein